MSGGSFAYLFREDGGENWPRVLLDEIDEGEDWVALDEYERPWAAMMGALLEYDAADVAEDMRGLSARTRSALAEIGEDFSRMSDVFKAMEWWQSGDWGEEEFRKALADYRRGRD